MTSEEAEEIRRITAMTAQSPDLLSALKDGYAPLHIAASKGHLAVVRHLLEEGAAVDVPDKWGESPLQFAVRSGHLAVAEALLDAGANVQGTARATPLHSAVARAYTRIIELLLARGASLQVAREVNVAVPGLEPLVSLVTTPLGVTAVQNRLDVAAFLLDRGADPDFCEGENCGLPINLSASAEMVELLLQRGADATLARPRLQGAIREKQGAILRRLLAAGTRPDSTNAVELRLALQVNGANLETVDLLVQHGADVNPVLAEITRRYPVDMLRWALDHGGDPNPPSTELSLLEATGIGELQAGESLAHNPAERIRLLLARGADPNRRFSNGLMLVHALAWQLTPALLGDARVDLNAVDMQGRTALMWAVAAANRDAVDRLLERGVEVNARDREGATALHIAAARRDLALVKRLLEAKADPAARLELRGLQPGDFLHRAVTFQGLWPRWNTSAAVPPGPSVDLKALRELLPPSAP
uniref:Ankyrin 23/unc44 n=1 Tax=uncultured microorganism TaxID=358574 RepID=F8UI09_9ZZZZ|nr:ankyrin 23/unc44 [uncultured microorganism]